MTENSTHIGDDEQCSAPPFKHTSKSRIGEFWSRLLGESTTIVESGPPRTRTLVLRADHKEVWPRATVACTRIVYKTIYKRFWVPNVSQSLYRVEIYVPSKVLEDYPASYFEPVVYPPLCNRWLEWTTYPHLQAIHAFMDTLLVRMRGNYRPFIARN